jgi:hypothetical protein
VVIYLEIILRVMVYDQAVKIKNLLHPEYQKRYFYEPQAKYILLIEFS